jgi:oligoribonuclease
MLVWIDLETTGLDPRKDRLLEVAAIVTDDAFVELARWQRVVRPYGFEPEWLDPVVRQMHTDNGLLGEVTAATLRRAGVDVLLRDFIETQRKLIGADLPVLAGSSVHFDREFMRWHLPLALERLHYRQLDVSSINELARRVWPAVYAARPQSAGTHRAMADLEDSIKLARYYARALEPKVEPGVFRIAPVSPEVEADIVAKLRALPPTRPVLVDAEEPALAEGAGA